ncbi:MAG: DUF3025 domain-containing protein [Gammaproteobacteria bacterium]
MTPPNTFRSLQDSTLHRNIAPLSALAHWQDWPSAAQLNGLLAANMTTAAGHALSFSYDGQAGDEGAAAYETLIDQTGIIPLRPRHWHDLFNALMWISFPATKATLNATHRRELAGSAGPVRSARRDALTLLDECGVLLVIDHENWTALHRAHDWTALFIEHRAAWGQHIVPMTIGHGLLEQCLAPYVGLTAKALHVLMPKDWFTLPDHERHAALDEKLHHAIARDECLMSTKELLPLPVLGIPGWWPANEEASFYANTRYFRPARS